MRKDPVLKNVTKNLYSIQETAALFSVSCSTIRNWRRSGYLPLQNKKIDLESILNLKKQLRKGSLTKLRNRANKTQTKETFIPKEYLTNSRALERLTTILSHIKERKLNRNRAICHLLLNLLEKKGLIRMEDHEISSDHKAIKQEIEKWQFTLHHPKYLFLEKTELPDHPDPIGIIYQSLREVRQKSKYGSYYTPSQITDSIKNDYFNIHGIILDPCCGTGQFLLSFRTLVEDPKQFYGMDIDEIAVKIARINLMIHYKQFDFTPSIFHCNPLLKLPKECLFLQAGKADLIVTNPPWGSHFSAKDLKKLRQQYPEIRSGESFSYFLILSLNLLKPNGILSFILPESILNTQIHSDIRNFLLKNYRIEKLSLFGKIFRKVFTKVVRIDIKKCSVPNPAIEIKTAQHSYLFSQNSWQENPHSAFTILSSARDQEILTYLFKQKHITLKENAEWAMGIVTGNNQKYLSKIKYPGYETIYRGKDISRFYLRPPQTFIQFTPDQFQQSAAEWKYRVKEKLIYRFVSKYLVFAYDDSQALSLNSANIVIPTTEYPLKVILALFNSSVYQFIFIKRFASIKVLKQHIQTLPLPLLPAATYQKIEHLTNRLITQRQETASQQKLFQQLDQFIFESLQIPENDRKYILEEISTK